jgi:hypothetical protein
MNWPYLHTIINHFPIILTVVGSAALVLAFLIGRRARWLYALATLTLAGLGSATWALIISLITGTPTGSSWWRMLARDANRLPPSWLRVAIALLAAFGLSVVARTVYLGGTIVRALPRLERPPAVQ